MINILLVDDHDLVRTGIRRLLDDVPEVKVVGEASSGEQAIEQVRVQRPDVVLMDIHMPGIGGLEATRKLLRFEPSLKIIALTVRAEEPFPQWLLDVGAFGYLSKGCDVKQMVRAIKDVHAGKHYIDPHIAQQLALSALPGKTQASALESLSHRERQVLLMVTQGTKTQEIATRLHLSPKTVATYRYRLFKKLGVKSDVELTHLAMRYGLVEDGAAVL